MLAMLFGCGFRRSELVGLELDEIQMRQGHWAVVDLIGKGGHIRTLPIPEWVKAALVFQQPRLVTPTEKSVNWLGIGHSSLDCCFYQLFASSLSIK